MGFSVRSLRHSDGQRPDPPSMVLPRLRPSSGSHVQRMAKKYRGSKYPIWRLPKHGSPRTKSDNEFGSILRPGILEAFLILWRIHLRNACYTSKRQSGAVFGKGTMLSITEHDPLAVHDHKTFHPSILSEGCAACPARARSRTPLLARP